MDMSCKELHVLGIKEVLHAKIILYLHVDLQMNVLIIVLFVFLLSPCNHFSFFFCPKLAHLVTIMIPSK